MPRLKLTIALLVSVIPSFGMAGVIIDAIEHEPAIGQSSISESLPTHETPKPELPQQLNTGWSLFGMVANSVTTISTSADGIGGRPVLLVKPVPHVESIYGLSEWIFLPDSPFLKIPKVPIV